LCLLAVNPNSIRIWPTLGDARLLYFQCWLVLEEEDYLV
jgi:hypothetical protein